jgi:hypothetical protein
MTQIVRFMGMVLQNLKELFVHQTVADVFHCANNLFRAEIVV